MATTNSLWLQKQITLSQRRRGCHLVTSEVVSAIRDELSRISVGICHIFILHTSAVSPVELIIHSAICQTSPRAFANLPPTHCTTHTARNPLATSTQ